MIYLEKFKLFESKRSDALLEKFLEHVKKYNDWIYKSKYPDIYGLPQEITEEILILMYLYMNHTDLYYWKNYFDEQDHTLTRNTVKKYVEKRIIDKWDIDNDLYYKIKELSDKKYYSQVDIMVFALLKRISRNNKPEKLQKIEDFNL